MPKLREDLFAVPDGEVYPKRYKAGEEVTGSVLQAAEDQGKLAGQKKKAAPAKKAATGAPENK